MEVLVLLAKNPEPTSGQVLYDGEALTKVSPSELSELRRHKKGMVFQHFVHLPHHTAPFWKTSPSRLKFREWTVKPGYRQREN